MYIDAAGVRTHYQKMGNGPILVLLHGWGCTWEIWAPIIAPLSEHYTLIIPDLPSFGASAHASTAWNSDDYAQWLDAFLRAVIGTASFALLGHSFGGKIACVYAQTHPKQLTHLIVVDASGIPSPLSRRKSLQQKVFSAIPSQLKEAIPSSLKSRLIHMTGSSTDYAVATPYQKAVLRKILSENITQALQTITVPTTILWGRHDQDTTLQSGEQFHSHISGSTLHVFDHSGHFPFVDETQRFIDVVMQILPPSHRT